MADRFEVQPHHVLRAVLDDDVAADVVRALGTTVDELRVTLAEQWLGAGDTIDPEEVEARGIDLETLVAALNPAAGAPAAWGGRRLAGASRDVLVRALGACGAMRHRQVSSGHLLLALMGCKDPVVARTFAAHGLRAKDARPLVQQWGRRAT